MTHSAETLVDPLLLRQTLSWAAGGAVSLTHDVPEDVVRSATSREGALGMSATEAVIHVDLSGTSRERVRVGHRHQSVYVWVENGQEGKTAEQFRIDIGAPFDGMGAQVRMAYGVLTIRLPLRCSDQSGLRRRL